MARDNNRSTDNLGASYLDWRRLRKLLFNVLLVAGGIGVSAFYMNGGLDGLILRADGFVTREHVTVAPAFDARVTQIFVKPGDRVEKGQVIAIVQSASIRRTLSEISIEKTRLISRLAEIGAREAVVDQTLPAAEASAKETAQFLAALTEPGVRAYVNSRSVQEMTAASLTAVERVAQLKAERGSLATEICADRSALDEARAAYQDLSTIYADGVLRSSTSGDVGVNVASIGQVLVGGAPVAEIYTGEDFVLAYLPDSYLFDVIEGQALGVKALNKTLNARVERVMPVAEALPNEFQHPNKSLDRGRLMRVALVDSSELPVNQKVRITACFATDCRVGMHEALVQASARALTHLSYRVSAAFAALGGRVKAASADFHSRATAVSAAMDADVAQLSASTGAAFATGQEASARALTYLSDRVSAAFAALRGRAKTASADFHSRATAASAAMSADVAHLSASRGTASAARQEASARALTHLSDRVSAAFAALSGRAKTASADFHSRVTAMSAAMDADTAHRSASTGMALAAGHAPAPAVETPSAVRGDRRE